MLHQLNRLANGELSAGPSPSRQEKQRNMDEQNWKAQMDAVHDVLDTKAPALGCWEPWELPRSKGER
eukprot:Skav227880  [mRNA]  locus=scaffold2896:305492:305692:+ [translate_table: standard]